MSDESRHAASELSRDLRYARQALGHDVGDLPPPPRSAAAPPPFHDAADVRAWFEAHREHVLVTLREADAEVAAALLAEVWPVVPPDADEAWCRRLYDVSVDLAAALPTSLTLATALRRGAESLRAREAYRLAAALGMHELAVHRQRDDDPGATAAALTDLAATYRAQDLLHEVVDCLDEALEVYLRHGHQAGVARSLTELGAVMLEAGRPDAAVDHLLRADKAFEDARDPVRHAECLALLGRAWWRSGDQAAAHRAFNRALAVLIGLDDVESRRVRDLVARLRSLAEEDGGDDLDQRSGGGTDPRQES